MKNYIFIITLLINVIGNAQCDIKTNNRPDGNTIKYFNPKPVIRQNQFEVGTAIYKNETKVFILFHKKLARLENELYFCTRFEKHTV